MTTTLNPEKAAQGFIDGVDERSRMRKRMGSYGADNFTMYELLAIDDGAFAVKLANDPNPRVAFKRDEVPTAWIRSGSFCAELFDGAGGFLVSPACAPNYREHRR